MLKRIVLGLIVAAFVAVPVAAMANDGALAGEAQAFQNQTVTADQSAGIQQIQQCSITNTTTKDNLVTASGYGSVAALGSLNCYGIAGAGLAFGKVTVEGVKTVTNDVTFATVHATINTMSQDVTMAGNSGASATGLASASAGNNSLVAQAQYKPYAGGGGGGQLVVAGGYTQVHAGQY